MSNPVGYEKKVKLHVDSYGSVWKGSVLRSSKRVLIREINLKHMEEGKEEIIEEVKNLKKFTDRTFFPEICDPITIEDDKIWIVKKTGTFDNLTAFLMPEGLIPENCIRIITRELLKALEVLHSCGFVHGAINPDNILFDLQNNVKLNLCIFEGGRSPKFTSRRHSFIGVPIYFPPEMITSQNHPKPFKTSFDIWSFGITLLYSAGIENMMKFYDPQNKEMTQVLFEIPKLKPPKLEEGKSFSSEFEDFISKCLQKDPSKRATASELLNHPFIKDNSCSEEEEKKIMDEASMNCTCFKQAFGIGLDPDSSSSEDENMMSEEEAQRMVERIFWSWEGQKYVSVPQGELLDNMKILKKMNETGVFRIEELGEPSNAVINIKKEYEGEVFGSDDDYSGLVLERCSFLVRLGEQRGEDLRIGMFRIMCQSSVSIILAPKVLFLL